MKTWLDELAPFYKYLLTLIPALVAAAPQVIKFAPALAPEVHGFQAIVSVLVTMGILHIKSPAA